MACEVAFVQNGSGLIFIASGLLTRDDLMESKGRVLEFPARIKQCMYCIVDLFAVSSTQLSASDVEEIARHDKRVAAVIRPGAIVAIMAPRESDYGLGRMWETLAESTGWETMVFRSREEGEAWLRARVKEKFDFDAI
jgi:hypothetical protein